MIDSESNKGSLKDKLLSAFESSKTSVYSLLFANFIILVGVLLFGWSAWELILIYWAESAIIGFFNIFKILYVRGPPGIFTRIGLTLFFIIHYSGFMLIHLLVLSLLSVLLSAGQTIVTHMDQIPILLVAIIPALVPIFISHAISFTTNYLHKKEYARTNVGILMFFPYGRIFAMQIFIFFSAFFLILITPIFGTQISFYIFLPLAVIGKTFFDLLGHLGERMMNRVGKR
ncbi:hypothetical protein KJ780_04090 [Candidatus Micrarchaeota archaeon]|nr:hypothetical protein [Candidatus Micrarchaeota archaeon]